MSAEYVLINGARQTHIDVADRGFQYGDGLFETLEVLQGIPLFLEHHLDRLQTGCERLQIPMPDRHLLIREACELTAHAAQAVLKIIITRGPGGRGYLQPETIQTTRLLALSPYPDFPRHYQTDGVVVRFCRHRLGMNPDLAGIKHMNRLEQILARAEWKGERFQEGLMINQQGHVIEGTMSNVFYYHRHKLKTPPVDQCGVAGIVRALVVNEAMRLSIDVQECYFTPEQLLQADEIFVTNSIIGIWPVNSLADKKFACGPVTRKLQQMFAQLRTQNVNSA